ncbi:diguanylate cyclase [Ectothiorhodospiraceae bacterium WFHF3C12]|nr:diguanylate cyclase [Ectothiorhodospiraceae bacterium WFHF3C12]
MGDRGVSGAVAGRVDALVETAEREHEARYEAYGQLLRGLLLRMAPAQSTEDAAVLELLADSMDSPLEPAELRQIQAVLESMEAPTPGSGEASATAGEAPAGHADDSRHDTAEEPDEGEHRANNLFKDHLDHRTREFETLRARLCQQARDTMHANEEARRLLDSLTTRLQLGTTVPEVLDARLELAEEVQRVADAHDRVAQKLETTFTSLQSLTVDNERLQEELQRVRVLSLTDESTDLPNRRAFLRQLKAEAARARREGGRFSVAILDLDHFKAINDRSGHGAGDEVLRMYATRVLTAFRAHDLVARYGGEEFAILLPSTPAADARRAVAKIREVAEGIAVEWESETIPLPTFSAGVAEFSGTESPEALINRADRALYRAKANGRDRIELDPELPSAATSRPRLLRESRGGGQEWGISN